MKRKYFRYTEMQLVIMLIIFFALIFFLASYQRSEERYQLASVGQSITYSLGQHIAVTEGTSS
ncbi:heme/copper-type cytochrome/quinol oxidase subunit 2 [Anaerotaenia torta]|uniref:hypothetical protein n=1 Tax=Anaerotaenia torta TaxID=433293 RepID=UPI003D1F2B4C